MPRSNPIRAVCGKSLLIGLVVATGCAQFADRSPGPPCSTGHAEPTSMSLGRRASLKRRPATGRRRTRRCSRPSPRNPAKEPRPARRTIDRRRYHQHSKRLHVASDSNRPSAPAMSLPSDSDEATLDAIAATGKPLTLADAITLAFRYQPRLRAQLENIAQARGQQQIAFSTFLPMVAANYDVGEYSLGSGGQLDPVGEGPPGIQFHTRRWERYPSASTSGRISSSPSSRSNGCSSTSAVGWAVTSKRDWRPTSLSSRPTALTRRWPMRSQSPTTTFSGARPCGAPPRMPSAAPRRSSRMLASAQREGVIEREVVLRAEVQRAENASGAPRRH